MVLTLRPDHVPAERVMDLNIYALPDHAANPSAIMAATQELFRAEVAITIEEWLRRIPDFTVAADADTQCSGGIVGQVNRLVLEWEKE